MVQTVCMNKTIQRLSWIIAGTITIATASWAEFLVQKKHHLIGGGINRVFLFLLINTHVLIMGLLLFLIIRHAIKLFMERRNGVAGSIFTRNLVLSFMLFSVLPATFTMGVAGMVIIKSINQWFQVRLDNVFFDTNKLHSEHTKQLREQLAATGKTLAAMLSKTHPEETRASIARNAHVTLYDFLILENKMPQLAQEASLWRAFRKLNDRTTKSLRKRFIQLLHQHRGGSAFDFFGSLYWVKQTPHGWVLLAYRYPANIRSALISSESAHYDYTMLRQLRGSIQLSYVFSFALLVLLIIFLSLWAAFYLARGITKPLAQLLEATKRLQNGEVGVTVPVLPQSDLQVLAEAFNQMTQALMIAQQRIEQEQKVKIWQEAAKQVAHEIKNPLTPIQLATERLQRKFSKQLEGEPLFEDCTNTIIDQVATIKTLIHYFVQFASLPPVHIAPHHIAHIISDVFKLYRASYPAITFTIIENSMLPVVYTDAAKIKLVLINLLDNSIRAFQHSKSNIQMITVTLGINEQTNVVTITYADTGPGIPKHLRETLFLPYVSTDKKNLGLGLAIVHQIFKQLGGSIILDPTTQGATFVCHLPQHQDRPKNVPLAANKE